MTEKSEEDTTWNRVILSSEEFSIANDKIPLVEENKDRIEEMFIVELGFGLKAENSNMQWINISGEEDNRTRARDYVKALCNPTERSTVPYPPALHGLLSSTGVHEKLEKQSRTVILFPREGEAEIQGNDELHMMLAISAIEDLITKFQQTEGEASSPQTSQASRRLDAELRRLSAEHQGNYDDDYSSMPDAVKRSILSWFIDESPKEDAVDSVEGMTHQMNRAGLASPEGNAKGAEAEDQECSKLQFYTLGKNLGYSEEEVGAVLQVYGTLLDREQFSQALATQRTSKPHPMEQLLSPHLNGKKKRTRKHKGKKAPVVADDYLQLLSRDFQEEGGEMGLHALKERSAARINMLQLALDAEPVITDVRLNTGDRSDEEEAVDSPDWQNVTHKKPYSRPQEGSTYQPQNQPPGGSYQRNRRPGSPWRRQSPNYQHPTQGRPYKRDVSPYPPTARLVTQIQQTAWTGAKKELKYIIIDGSNIAMTHSNGKYFSCRGIEICVNYFLKRGHREVTVFVPQWRTHAPKPDYPIQDQQILFDLKHKGHLVFTPARRVPGKNIVCYDDRFVIRLAIETEGIIVSNDNYRDLWQENEEYRPIIETRLLPFTFVGDFFMPPDDPLGREGPTLDDFLIKGNDYQITDNSSSYERPRTHSEGDTNRYRGPNGPRYPGRGQNSGPRAPYPQYPQAGRGYGDPRPQYPNQRPQRGGYHNNYDNQGNHGNWGQFVHSQDYQQNDKQQNAYAYGQSQNYRSQTDRTQTERRQTERTQTERTPSKGNPDRNTTNSGEEPRPVHRSWLRGQLLGIFPDNADIVDRIMSNHPSENDLNKLSSYVLEVLNDSHWQN